VEKNQEKIGTGLCKGLRLKFNSAEGCINMGKTLGYMITWTTYGTWLQGDKRGWVKDGTVLEANKELEEANKDIQKYDVVILNGKQRQIIETAILEEARKINEKIPAISVRSNHVHVVIDGGTNPVDEVVSRFKNAGYFAVRKEGGGGRIWARGYDKRYCFDKESLQERIRYVKGHKKNTTAHSTVLRTGGVGDK
jgi:REP element-mobilizing transposase RayT